MGKRNNSIIISGVLVAFLIGTMVSGPQAIAANPVLTFLENTIVGLLNNIQTTVSGNDVRLDTIEGNLGDISASLNRIEEILDATPPSTCEDNCQLAFDECLNSGEELVLCEENFGFCFDSCQAPEPPSEICNDGVDNDGDGLVDQDDPDCQPTQLLLKTYDVNLESSITCFGFSSVFEITNFEAQFEETSPGSLTISIIFGPQTISLTGSLDLDVIFFVTHESQNGSVTMDGDILLDTINGIFFVDNTDNNVTCQGESFFVGIEVAPSLDTCEQYCDLVQQNCVDNNGLYQDITACLEVCSGFDTSGAPGDATGDTLQCRTFFAELAGIDAVPFCQFASEDGGGVCIPGACGDGVINDSEECDDGNTIDGDGCSSVCTIELEGCDDGNICTNDFFDIASGGCINEVAVGLACDDGDSCSVNDVCDGAGLCVGTALVCDDGVACTQDTCSEGLCSIIPNDSLCDDGLFCNGQEVCDIVNGCIPSGDPCVGGTCNEAADVCEP